MGEGGFGVRASDQKACGGRHGGGPAGRLAVVGGEGYLDERGEGRPVPFCFLFLDLEHLRRRGRGLFGLAFLPAQKPEDVRAPHRVQGLCGAGRRGKKMVAVISGMGGAGGSWRANGESNWDGIIEHSDSFADQPAVQNAADTPCLRHIHAYPHARG